jgi:hypothetical protein
MPIHAVQKTAPHGATEWREWPSHGIGFPGRIPKHTDASHTKTYNRGCATATTKHNPGARCQERGDDDRVAADEDALQL